MPFERDRWRPCRKPHILSDPTAKRLLCITIGCVLAGVCTYLASVTILSVMGAGIRPTACATQDCVQHALILLGTLNTSADPCVDFHAYVCGNDSQASRQASENLLYIKHIFPRISSLQSSPYRSEAAEVLSFNALQSCLNGVVGASAGPFVEFMAARKMPWPATDANRHLEVIDIFDILLDLAVNWRVGLWFDVTLYKKKDGPSTIVVGEPGALVLQRMEQLSRLDHPLYRDLVKEVSLYLSNGSVKLSSSNIEELRQDETVVRSALLSSPSDEHDDLLPLHRIDTYVHGTNSAEWLDLLRKYIKSSFTLSLIAPILMVKARSIKLLFTATNAIATARLLNLIGWMFAYIYVWTVNQNFISLDGTNETAGFSPEVLCFLAVHESFGIAQAAPFFHEMFDAAAREAVFAVVNMTRETIVHAIGASNVLSEFTKKEAQLKFTHMDVKLWPPDAFLVSEKLDMMYAGFPRAQSEPFFGTWVNSRKALQALMLSPLYYDLMIPRYSWHTRNALYLYTANSAWFSISALLPPSFFPQGNAVMSYSGLGFQLTRQLLRAVDDTGIHFDHAGKVATWWEQNKPWALGKVGSSEEKARVADLVALDMSLAALKRCHGLESITLRLKLMEKFSPVQTFYMSFCSRFCNQSKAPTMCNLATNSPEFRRAFRCHQEGIKTYLFF